MQHILNHIEQNATVDTGGTMDNRAKLRALMIESGMKSKDVALVVNRNQSTVRRYMCGLSVVKDEILAVLEMHIKERQTKDRLRTDYSHCEVISATEESFSCQE